MNLSGLLGQLPWLPPQGNPLDRAAYGENCEYEAPFLAVQQLLQVQGEQQFGATIIPAQVPDWARVSSLSQTLLQGSADVRLFLILAQAQLQLHGLPAFSEVLSLLLRSLELGWEHVHPRLDEDGESDPLPRINALAALADMDGMGKHLRDAVILSQPHRSISLREAEQILDGSIGKSQALPGRERLIEELRRGYADGAPELLAVVQLHDFLKKLRVLIESQLGSEWALPLEGVLPSVTMLYDALSAGSGHENDLPAHAESVKEFIQKSPSTQPGPSHLQAWQSVRLSNREDVVLLLDKLIRYYETHEPSHPAPILLKRTQQLVPMGFHEIIQDLAPNAVEQIQLFMPRQPEQSSNLVSPTT